MTSIRWSIKTRAISTKLQNFTVYIFLEALLYLMSTELYYVLRQVVADYVTWLWDLITKYYGADLHNIINPFDKIKNYTKKYIDNNFFRISIASIKGNLHSFFVRKTRDSPPSFIFSCGRKRINKASLSFILIYYDRAASETVTPKVKSLVKFATAHFGTLKQIHKTHTLAGFISWPPHRITPHWSRL